MQNREQMASKTGGNYIGRTSISPNAVDDADQVSASLLFSLPSCLHCCEGSSASAGSESESESESESRCGTGAELCRAVWEAFIRENEGVIENVLWPFCDDSSTFRLTQVNKLTHQLLNIANYPIKQEMSLQTIWRINSVKEFMNSLNHGDAEKQIDNEKDCCREWKKPRGNFHQTKLLRFSSLFIHFQQDEADYLTLLHLFTSVKQIRFGCDFNRPLPPRIFPPSLTSLTFGHDFNQPLSAAVFPSSLQSLTFGDEFNQDLPVDLLPTSLTSLTFGYRFNQSLSLGLLPSSLKSLEFGLKFNRPIGIGILPSRLTTLRLGSHFNHPLTTGVFSCSLTSLTFGNDFNQPLQRGLFPCSLTALAFGSSFNQPLSTGIFPCSLTSLTFGYDFNQLLVPGTLPCSLSTLIFGPFFNRPIAEGVLPCSLRLLQFSWSFRHRLEKVLPAKLQELVLYDRYDHSENLLTYYPHLKITTLESPLPDPV